VVVMGRGPATAAALLDGVVLIEHGRLRFVFSPVPPPELIKPWVERLHEYKVGMVVRVSEEQPYTHEDLEDMELVEFPLTDGSVPSKDQSKAWDELVGPFLKTHPGKAVAVHCTAGLGRSALLVAISLVNDGLDAYKAIELLRSKRRGVLNSKQVAFLLDYRARRFPCSIL
jgi:protein tyrosine phosphatase type IVA